VLHTFRICIKSLKSIYYCRLFVMQEILFFRAYLRINNAIKGAIEFDIDRFHCLAALDIKAMNMRRMFEIVASLSEF